MSGCAYVFPLCHSACVHLCQTASHTKLVMDGLFGVLVFVVTRGGTPANA